MTAKTLFNQSSGTPTVTSKGIPFAAVDVNNAGVTSFKLLDDMVVHGPVNLIAGKFDQNGFNLSTFSFTNSIGANYETNGGNLIILKPSLLFNGIDEIGEKVLTSGSNILTQGTGDVAMGVWFKSVSSPSGTQFIWNANRNTTSLNDRAITILLQGTGAGENANKITGLITDNQTPVTQVILVSDATFLGNSEWVLAEFVRRSGTAFLYIKGREQLGTAASAHVLSIGVSFASFSLFVGARDSGTATGFFDGNIGPCWYIDGPVSSADALAHWNNGVPETSAPAGAVSYYALNDITGHPTVPDSVGSNNITLVNTIECENVVSDFPAGVSVAEGRILTKIVDPIINPII